MTPLKCVKYLTHICPGTRHKPKTLYSELVNNNNNNNDHKSYDANQWNPSYSALLTSCSDQISDCKLQITELHIKVNNIFTSLDHSKHN